MPKIIFLPILLISIIFFSGSTLNCNFLRKPVGALRLVQFPSHVFPQHLAFPVSAFCPVVIWGDQWPVKFLHILYWLLPWTMFLGMFAQQTGLEDEPWKKYVKRIKPVMKAFTVRLLSYGTPEIGKSRETETIDEWLPSPGKRFG